MDHVITKISEMDIKQQPSNVELNDTKRQKLDVVEPQPSTSAASHGPDLKASVSKEDAGQVEGESLSFYHSVVMLLLINLREMNQDDIGFQYQVWTKRKEYGKLGDIVMGENDDALAIYNHIIEEQTKQFGATHPNVLAVMSNKAAILRNTFKHEEALIIYSHIVDILTAELGETHMKTLQSLRDKAEALIAMEKYKEAFDIYTHHHG
ncbi:hypothetical protein B566_EDAN013234, partial [Ephemera danica]